ncbi:c-type cytochrome [Flexithrix dorotheae]|uniref:c-type cytochrome n=1 Tax=Flexithrix dorotheae TaxID=70993 RepID=UPI00037DDC42|nr:c-type cytochrome [Flexithrix dorotheae]
MKNILIKLKAGKSLISLFALLFSTVFLSNVSAQESPLEEDFFKIMKVPSPEGTILEVGGLTTLPNGDLAISTRRGDVYIVENPTSMNPYFRKFASGLHEILGLEYKDGALYCAQRGELTKLVDTNKDGYADVYETVSAWPISGHYHEYSYGPKIAPDGSFFVSGNVAFGNEEWWRGESRVPWRGWIFKIHQDGQLEPWATGMRSPCGLSMIDGELFYTDNQGDWFGSGGIWQVEKGDFVGHPAGLAWSGSPNSPVTLSEEEFFAKIDNRQVKNENGRYIKPENITDEKDFKTLYDVKKEFDQVKLPAVWLPHGILGISNSEIVKIPEYTFGPFQGQLLVGDQGQSKIMRVHLEKINGEYQGAAWDFRSGFQSGVLRMSWAEDGSLFVGETNRGWGSAGEANEGLQRLIWNDQVPFEMLKINAKPDGFEIEFTQPVDKATAEDIASYSVYSYTYKYHPVYGSPPVKNKTHKVKGVLVSDDGMKARIIVDSLQQYHVHAVSLTGVRDKNNSYSLVHPTAYYTLNNIPNGEKLDITKVSTKDSSIPVEVEKKPTKSTTSTKKTAPTKKVVAVASAAPTYDEVKGILTKNTCLACHNTDKKQIGPAFKDVAKRKYTPEQIVELIYNPKPENWPGYATEMPPMPQVPKAEALKIAKWINSLD